LRKTDTLAVIEDNVISGGFGSSLLEFMNENSLKARVKLLGYPDEFIPHGDTNSLYRMYGLDEASIYKRLLEFVGGGKAIGF
jgi:1-deoxy-D-xylulose-5-phosphate synthase